MSKKNQRETQVVQPHEVSQLDPSTALALRPPDPRMLEAPQISAGAAIFLEEYKGPKQEVGKIPLIRIDHNAGQFVLPTGEMVEHVAGYPVYAYQTRLWYKGAYKEGSKDPPDCFSGDLVAPHPNSPDKQSPMCATCPQAKFGTHRSGLNMPSCATINWLFLVNPEFGNPPIAVLKSGPSSIRAIYGAGMFDPGYLGRAKAKAGAYQIVWSLFGLESGGDRHYVISPIMGPVASDEGVVRKLAALANAFMETMNRFRGAPPDDRNEEQGEEGPSDTGGSAF